MIEDRLTEDIEVNATAKPRFSTEIVTTDGGHEVRNSRWAYPRHVFEFNLAPNTRDSQDFLEFRDLYYAAGGAFETFRFKHWADFEGENELLGIGDGLTTEFQLVRNYTRGAVTRQRKITRPVADTVAVYRNGILVGGAGIDYDTGIVTIAPAPAIGQQITADFEFDIPVRFMDDEIEMVGVTDTLEQPVSISLFEVRE